MACEIVVSRRDGELVGHDGWLIRSTRTDCIRTPSVVTLRYSGNEAAGFNRWRRLMREHFSPRQHGTLEPVVLPTAANFASIPFEDCNETNQVLAIRNAASYLKPAGVDTCKPPRYRCHLGCILLNRR